jgi:hypothetical protein
VEVSVLLPKAPSPATIPCVDALSSWYPPPGGLQPPPLPPPLTSVSVADSICCIFYIIFVLATLICFVEIGVCKINLAQLQNRDHIIINFCNT